MAQKLIGFGTWWTLDSVPNICPFVEKSVPLGGREAEFEVGLCLENACRHDAVLDWSSMTAAPRED